MTSLRRNVSANLLSNVWSTALSLLLTPVYVRVLGVESYGLVGFYMSWVSILAILDTGISATATREVAWLRASDERRGEVPIVLRSLEVVYWLLVSLVGGALLAAAWWVGDRWFTAYTIPPATVRDAMALMALSLVVQVPSGLYVGGLIGLQRQVESSGLLALFGTVRGFGALAVLWFVSRDIRAFFLWQIVSSALQTGVLRMALWRASHVAGSPARFSLSRVHALKGFAGIVILVSAISVIMAQSDKLILSRSVSLEELGYYMVAWTVAAGLSRVVVPLVHAFSPRFTALVARGDTVALAAEFGLANRLLSAVVIAPAVVLSVLAEPILSIWLGSRSVAAPAASLLPLLVAGVTFVGCSFPAQSVLYSKNETRSVLRTQLATTVTFLPALVWAAHRFGATGAATTWAAYGVAQYVAFQATALRSAGVRVVPALARDFAAPLLAAAVVAAPFVELVSIVRGRLAVVAVIGVALAVAWIASALAAGDLRTRLLHQLGRASRATV